MPKKSKKGPVSSLGDVTVLDYADSTAPKNRAKKLLTNVNRALRKEVEKAKDKDENLPHVTDALSSDEDEAAVYYMKMSKTKNRRHTNLSNHKYNRKNEGGKTYPIDIWFLLSEYIRPEDVGVFAAICKSSFQVTCSAAFWFSLYRRYYTCVPDMPASLRPEKLIRKTALRKDVIRSFFYMYKPFRNRLTNTRTSEVYNNNLSVLVNKTLYEISSESQKGSYTYYFKMAPKISSSSSRSVSDTASLLDVLDDVFYNPNDQCCALKVVCRDSIPILPISGLTLRGAVLSSSVQFHKLKLEFGPMYGRLGGSECVTVNFDAVVQVLVVDWWHRLYPFHGNHMLDLADSLNWCLKNGS
uniref:Transmembrane protein 183 n=1 Tax=Dendroctonus ponderosae TaxID=77166 RepID=A0AAR5QI85_DENPD